jgi:hypothetical protein
MAQIAALTAELQAPVMLEAVDNVVVEA